ncbi:hypothetical protein ACWEKR_06210 [Nocardia sp. NPDC004573]
MIGKRGESILDVRYCHPTRGDLEVRKVYFTHPVLGDILVWDGTVAVLVEAPTLLGVGALPAAGLVTGSTIAAVSLVGAGALPAPSAGGGMVIAAPALLGTGAAPPPPSVDTGVDIVVPVLLGVGSLPTPQFGDSILEAPALQGIGVLPTPSVSVGATISAPALLGAGALPVPAVSVGAGATAPALVGAGVLPAPAVAAGAGAAAPALLGTGVIAVPSVGAGATIAAPALAGAGALPAPTVTTAAFSPMGMDKLNTFAIGSDQTALIPSWTPRSGYPNTSIVSDALKSNGPSNVVIQCKVTMTAAWFSSTALTLRILKNGTTIGTASLAFNATSITFSPISTTLALNDTIALQYTSPFGASGTVQSGGTNTYVYYDVA